MRKLFAALLVLTMIASASCAVKGRSLRLERDDNINTLSGPEVESDLAHLTLRVNGLWGYLTEQKLTPYIAKRKLAPYFRDEKSLSEFIAIYASLFRQLDFDREIVRKYKINSVVIEENGVIGLVDIEIRGRIYAIWYAKIHEVEKWVKYGGEWYLEPQAY